LNASQQKPCCEVTPSHVESDTVRAGIAWARMTRRRLRSMAESSLQKLYEDSSTPLSSGLGRAERQAAILSNFASGFGRRVTAIDIGCGDGMCTEVALKICDATPHASVDIVGFDWSLAALDQARARGLPVVRASADDGGLPLASSSVDVVIMSELIEHLVDPDNALDEAWRVLAPGGMLLLSTPNLAAWYNRVLLAVGVQPLFTEVSLRGIYGRPGKEVVGHLRLFTRRALIGLLEAIGFSGVVVAGAPYHDVPDPFKWLDRLLCHVPSLASNLLATARKPLQS
jgi:ubiquinone/menaquinone biosynthesis C-methylase UbiE